MISSVSEAAGSPDSASASRTSAAMSECWSCLTDRFTLIESDGSVGSSSWIWRPWRQASRSTQRPIGTIRPISSASGMKVSGPSIPRSGWCQRSSASTPLTPPSERFTSGW